MDAKPHRPARHFRVRDENVPPQAAPMGKVIHSRNKSTSALSTTSQMGVFKPTAKRTAFADVSNTARTAAQVKDDIILSSKAKATVLPPSLSASIRQITRSTTLLRPAQRPSSQAHAAKAPPSSHATSVSIAPATDTSLVTTKPATSKAEDALPPARKTLSRKGTAVFRETEVSVQKDTEAVAVISRQPDLQEAASRKTLTATTATTTTTTATSLPESAITTLPLEDASKNAQVATEIKYAEAVASTLSSCIPIATADTALPPIKLTEQDENRLALDVKAGYAYLESLEHNPQIREEKRDVEAKTKASALPVEEPVEYWPVEEDEEYYDADGYTTTRSLRSRGDNTTGPVTLVICPRVTTRIQEELVAAKAFVESTKSFDDIEEECWDTTMVAEYGDDIFDYMRTLEDRLRPNPYYMDNQVEIQWSMRSVLMDWLVQVHHRFGLLPETLFLSVNYVDRFLSCKIVSLGKLQLVGATAIFVAAKYEEINCPSVQEIEYMVDGGYTTEEILKAERFMLSMLQFDLGWPGPMSFLRRISKADDYDLETRTLAKYFLEVTVMDERFVGCAPSFTAAASHCLARLLLRKGDWSPAHVYYSNYTYSQIRQLVSVILECCETPLKHHAAVYEKYMDNRYKRASLFVEGELQRGFQLPPLPRESAGSSQSWRRK